MAIAKEMEKAGFKISSPFRLLILGIADVINSVLALFQLSREGGVGIFFIIIAIVLLIVGIIDIIGGIFMKVGLLLSLPVWNKIHYFVFWLNFTVTGGLIALTNFLWILSLLMSFLYLRALKMP